MKIAFYLAWLVFFVAMIVAAVVRMPWWADLAMGIVIGLVVLYTGPARWTK